MAKMLCVPCSMEFSTETDYVIHKKGGHVDKSKGLLVVGPNSEVDPEFAATVARIEAKKNEPPTPDTPAPVQRPELPDPKPVKLTYHFEGECPTCRNPVTTLELDIDSTHAVIAHCVKCNKQLEARKEKNLNA